MSSTGGPANFSVDMYGNPCYTIKDGGTLKKKMQPYAADKTSREGMRKDRDIPGPGTYNITS